MCWNYIEENISVDDYKRAVEILFRTKKLSPKQKELLLALFHANKHSASDIDLAVAATYATPLAASQQIGKIGEKIAEALGREPKNPESGAYLLFVGYRYGYEKKSPLGKDDKRWVMDENLAKAIEESLLSI